jgi:hypothetical protein
MDETNKVYLKINDKFKLDIEQQLRGSGYRFGAFHEIIDLVNDTKYFSIEIENTDLNFQDRDGLFEVLIKFIDKEIANIPNELEDLESQRSARDFDDYRHFYDTEALSEKEHKLSQIKKALVKNFRPK